MQAAEIIRLLSNHGTCTPQNPDEWNGELPLPDALADFFQQVGPTNITLDGPGNPIELFRLSQIWALQVGYRWHGLTNEPLPDWPSSWIVIAQAGGDPFIFDVNSEQVLFGRSGSGNWATAETAFHEVGQFYASVAALAGIYRNCAEFYTDDWKVHPKVQAAALDVLATTTGSSAHASKLVGLLGWR